VTAQPAHTNDLEGVIRAALNEIAPDLDSASIAADDDFHDDLGLDSMDALNLAVALHEATGVDIPERDASKITSIASCVAYLRTRIGAD
jgi:acyl carrier protein